MDIYPEKNLSMQRSSRYCGACSPVHGFRMQPQTQYARRDNLDFFSRQKRIDMIIFNGHIPCHSERRGNIGSSVRALAPGSTDSELEAMDAGLAKVVLKGGKARLFRGDRRSTVVYPGAIDCVIGRPPPENGDVVIVCDGKRDPLGLGIINLDSVFAVRILEFCRDDNHFQDIMQTAGSAHHFVREVLVSRIELAATLRRTLGFGHQVESHDPQGTLTTAFRLVNAEGDYLPGLIVDVFGHVCVVSSSALWVEKHRDIIEAAIRHAIGSTCTDIVWRPAIDMLKLEGVDTITYNESETFDDMNCPQEVVTVFEHGVSFFVSPYGQKTGFYCDQRDNRRQIMNLSQNKSVLDMCCYSGAFAIHAALGGASCVTAVDSSGPALELARRNAGINGCDHVDFIKQDAAKFLDDAFARDMSWDIVVLDPPKLAPSRKTLSGAIRKYVSLNTKAMKIVKKGGLLMTCSCSGAMTQSPGEFVKVIQTAAYRAGVKATILSRKGAGADHPIDPHYPEGEYLSNYIVRIY